MAATTALAKLTKLNNRKSKRDIQRELRIAQKGGQPIDVFYGSPLNDEDREERVKLEIELRYPTLDKQIKSKVLTKNWKPRLGAFRTEKEFIRGTLVTAKIRARSLGIPFDLTLEGLSVPDVCPIFNTPMSWSNKLTNDTPSLDRLIPEKGYVKDNVAFISMRANRIKSDASLEDLLKITEWMQRKENDNC
jgi:hypothetical protein